MKKYINKVNESEKGRILSLYYRKSFVKEQEMGIENDTNMSSLQNEVSDDTTIQVTIPRSIIKYMSENNVEPADYKEIFEDFVKHSTGEHYSSEVEEFRSWFEDVKDDYNSENFEDEYISDEDDDVIE